MRRITTWILSTITIVVLLFGYHTSTNSPAPGAASGTTGSTGSSGSGSTSGGSAGSGSSGSGTGGGSTKTTKTTKTTTGPAVDTRWGPVQVKITTKGKTLTKVTVLQSPNGNPRDAEINDQALPILTKEALDAQSANIDMVSGATVTSQGYLSSLQAALDEAGI